jgi:hypothetical protein
MKPETRFRRLSSMALTMLMLLTSMVFSAVPPTQLNLYDKSNNHLLTVVFVYDVAGQLVGRTVYTSDGTFLRDVEVHNSADGKRSEVSKNFNTPNNKFGGGDTMFVTNYTSAGAVTSFTIQDQFKLDHLGGAVSYTPAAANPLLYDLAYQSDNSRAGSVLYETDAQGNLTKVNIYTDPNGAPEYYGVFSSVGVKQQVKSAAVPPQIQIQTRGPAGIDVQLNMGNAGQVKCELMTLSGRVAGVLLDEMVPKGNFLRSFHTGSQIKAANGVYIFVVSFNGKVVSGSRYLHQAAMGGIR